MKNGSLLTFAFLFIFSTSIFSQTTTWDGPSPGVWDGTNASNWTNGIPGAGYNVVIEDGDVVTLKTTVSINSIDIGNGTNSSSLIIDNGNTLTTTGSSDGVFIVAGGPGQENSLVVNGDLIINGSTGDGIESRENTSLNVGSTGSITINSPDDNGFEIWSEFMNSGEITVNTPKDRGLLFKASSAGSTLINNNTGSITVTSATNQAIHLSDGPVTLTNDGTLSLTSGGNIIDDPGTLINNGTVKGIGSIEGGNDFVANNGSRLAPGTSIGKITFVNDGGTQDLSDIFFDIEIEGSTTPGTDYDQVTVGKSIDISDAVLNLIEGSYTPMAGDIFTIIDVPSGGDLIGTFNGIPEGGSVTFKGVDLYFSYQGGDGNDFTASFDSPLPVELIDFSARSMESEVKLNWSTANEVNNDYFTLERSTDGRNFEAIGMINGNGNTTEISKYTFMDKQPENGLNYYRLKQTDYDRSFTYSDIKTVKFESESTIKVYPTAVSHGFTVEAENDFDGETIVAISDSRGRTIATHTITAKSTKQEIDINNLIPGSYFVTIYNSNQVNTFRIIKL